MNPPSRGESPVQGDNQGDSTEALLRVAAAAAAANKLEDVLEAATEEALRVTEAASLSVSRFDPHTGQIQTLINVGDLGPGEERWPDQELYPMADCPQVRDLLETREPYFNDVRRRDCDPGAFALLTRLGKASDVGVAIVVEDEAWGEIWASRRMDERPFSDADAGFLKSVAEQVAVAINRAELFSRMARLAHEDTLTGLPNRRAFDARLTESFERATERGFAISLLLCDLDGLKAINDSQGHEMGDRALRTVADSLQSASDGRPGVFLARLAGDEFAALIDGAELETALRLGSDALDALRERTSGLVTMSSGAAAMQASGLKDGPSELMRNADAALYVAKRLGGNRVCSATEGRSSRSPDLDPYGSRRGDAPASLASAMDSLIADLDSRLAETPLLNRLEAVAITCARAGNFAYWSISRLAPGTEVLVDISAGDNREHDAGAVKITSSNDCYALADFPVTQRVIRQGAGSFFIDRNDEHADSAERRLLSDLGFQSVLGAVACTADDAYLVELYSDSETPSPWRLATALRMAAHAAVPPHRPLG